MTPPRIPHLDRQASPAFAEPADLPTKAALHAALAALNLDPSAPGAAIAVAAGSQTVTAAIGAAAPDGSAMTARTPVRLASLTKTFTAAAVLRLWETGRLDLDAPIANLVEPEHAAMLRTGGYDTGSITVRQLLMHTGGLADHAESPAYLNTVLNDPARIWTRTGQIAVMLDLGPPLSVPGAVFAYSDTGYVLLGGIIERAIGQPLGEAVRSLLRWGSLGLSNVRWEGEPPAKGPDAHISGWTVLTRT